MITTGTATGTISSVTGPSLGKTVTISSISGNGTLSISIAAGTASDIAGNAAPAAGPSATFDVVNTPTPTLGTYPTTSIPLSSDTTITPSATPTDTTSINVSTSTSFNGELTADVATGVVRVTNAHPANIFPESYTVTVTAFGPGGTTTKTFTLTVTSTPCGANFTDGFTNAADAGVGSNPYSVAIGDFNGDGKQDLAVANVSSNTVSIRLGDGLGGFSSSTDVSVGSNPYSVAIGDFNGDGKQDLAVANVNSNTVSIRLGDGLGGFSGSTEVSVGSGPVSVAIGDFNGDGKQDLAVANYGSNTVSIRLGDGAGGFSGTTEVSVGSGPFSVAIGDFNNDGKQDLAVANLSSNTVSIRLGDGLGGFSGATEVSVGSQPRSVAIGDFNGDGKQDLAVANSNSDTVSTVSIRLGDGLGGFSGATEVSVGSNPISVAIGDFNGDGKQDLAVANNGSNTVSIRLGDGLGGFSGATEVSVGSGPISVAIGDFNGDGKQDLAVANVSSDTVSIRLGGCTPVVINTNDSGPGSLRQALSDALAGDTITFAIPTTDPGFAAGVWTIKLTSGELLIDRSLTINGPASGSSITVDGNNASRVFHVTAGTVTLSGLTIANGRSGDGGGIFNSGTITLTNCTLSDNSADGGEGGGIFNSGTLALTNCTLSGNHADNTGTGGAIYNDGSAGTALVTITNSTLSGNSATQGGGIYNGTVPTAQLQIGNTILKRGSSGANINNNSGTVTSNGYNLSDDDESAFLNATGDQNSIDPLLEPAGLQNNGGPTQTIALQLNSPAIDKGKDLSGTGQDQRGDPRPVRQDPAITEPTGGDGSDIGAVEVNYALSLTEGGEQSTTITTTFATALKAAVTESGNPKSGTSLTFTAPASGASGTFPGNTTTATVTTNGSGVATAPPFTANSTAGSYTVAATVTGIGSPVNFSLTNTKASTTTSVSSSQNPSVYGDILTFTATVTSSAGTPTGTVQFTIDGVAVGMGPQTLDGSGMAFFTPTSLSTGTHTVTADYNGDGNFSVSSGTLAGGQVVNKAGTATSVSSSVNPSSFGQNVTFTATVTSSA